MPSYYRSGAEFGVNRFTFGSQTAPSVAGFANGGFVIAWGSTDTAQDRSESAIKAQLFDAAGAAVGPEFLVNSRFAGSQFTPSVAVLGNGNFVVSWVSTDASQDGSGHAIKAQLFSNWGIPIGGEMLVNTSAAADQTSPEIAPLANGGFVIRWDDRASLGIKAQLFGADGSRVGSEFMVSTTVGWFQQYGDIVGLADGGFVATWCSTAASEDGSSWAIKAQIFSATGARNGPEFLVNSQTAGAQYGATIAALTGGGFVIGWFTSDQTQDGSNGAIKAQMFSASGGRIGPEFLVNTQTLGSQTGPAATALPDGGFMIAWNSQDPAQDGSGSAIKAQIFSASGARVGGEYLVNSLATGSQFLPDLATFPDGRVIATWAGESGDGNGYAVRAQLFVRNEAPRIVSNGGGIAAVPIVDEGETAVTTVTALDAGGPEALRYAIIGGEDAALFMIDPVTGMLRFVEAPDREAPTDVGAHGYYHVTVSASDGELSDVQYVEVHIANVNEGLTITSGGGADAAAIAIDENFAVLTRITATDIDGDPVRYAIAGGSDASLFVINSFTGVLSFATAADYEAPADASGDNVYDVVVSASDGSFTDTQAIAFRIGNVDEALAITSNGGGGQAAIALAENGAPVTVVAAVDPEGGPVGYAIAGGADAARFVIDAATGVLDFVAPPDFESPADAGSDNIYDVIVSATDGTFTDTQMVAVTILDVGEGSIIAGTSRADTIAVTKTVPSQPYATAFDDRIAGLGGADTLMGGGGADIINGGAGNDVIFGNAGADLLTGGTGADRFTLKLVIESRAGAPDLIRDFSRGQGDRIGLADIDANANAAGNQGFTFIGTADFSKAGQVRFEQVDGSTFVSGDVNGDGVADFQIQLHGLIALTSADFIL